MVKVLITVALVLALLGGGVLIYVQHPKFGPSTTVLQSPVVLHSRNYVDGEFRNLEPTPVMTGDVTFLGAVWSFLTEKRDENLRPSAPIETVKTDLTQLDKEEDLVIWLGHSSYFVQLKGQRLLIDPVFSESAAPIPFVNRAFDGTSIYSAEDMPDIDFLLITHEHWDHLDYESVTALQPKVRHAIVALGLAPYLKQWGYEDNQLHQLDWNETLEIEAGLKIHALPARHYSRRLLTTNQTLWVSFALTTDKRKLYFSGDSGYGKHFKDIGATFGPFDYAALDSGQYDARWKHIHMTPQEALNAARDLKSNIMSPAHVGKFALARHAWDDPFKRLELAAQDQSISIVTPKIGEPFSHFQGVEQ